MARNALRDTAENLVRQGGAQVADLVRADAHPVVLADEHRDVAGLDAVQVRDVDTDLIHAHDADDRAAPPANRDVPAVGERARQTLPVADGGGRDPARRFGAPGAPVADAL